MSGFHSGVLLTKQHSERNKNDERRHGPKGEEGGFNGRTMSVRQHSTKKVSVGDKEKEEADVFPLDLMQVLSKKPDARFRWLHRGLTFASKKYVQISAIYDIATNKKFVSGVSAGIGKQMQQMLLANLHLFSSKQQRFLQSDASGFYQFVAGDDRGDSEASDSDASASPGRRRLAEGGHGVRPEAGRGASHSPMKAVQAAHDVAQASRAARLAELLQGSDNPLRRPPMLVLTKTSSWYTSRYPLPLPDIVPGEDVRKYAFGTADDFLEVGDDELTTGVISSVEVAVKGDPAAIGTMSSAEVAVKEERGTMSSVEVAVKPDRAPLVAVKADRAPLRGRSRSRRREPHADNSRRRASFEVP